MLLYITQRWACTSQLC